MFLCRCQYFCHLSHWGDLLSWSAPKELIGQIGYLSMWYLLISICYISSSMISVMDRIPLSSDDDQFNASLYNLYVTLSNIASGEWVLCFSHIYCSDSADIYIFFNFLKKSKYFLSSPKQITACFHRPCSIFSTLNFF